MKCVLFIYRKIKTNKYRYVTTYYVFTGDTTIKNALRTKLVLKNNTLHNKTTSSVLIVI